MNLQTGTDRLNIVVNPYRNNLYLKDNEIDLKFTESQSLLAKRVCLVSYIDIFYKCTGLYWMKQLFIFEINSVKNGCSFPPEHFPIVPGI